MTFDEMTFKEKVDHIWEYYKFHFAVALGVLLLIGSLLNIYLINPAPDIMLDLTIRVNSSFYNSDYGIELQEMMIEELVDYPTSQTIVVELLETGEQVSAQVMMASEAKFMGKSEVQELDLILMDEEQFRLMLSQGFFLDIEDLEEEYGIEIPDDIKIISTDPATQEDMVSVVDARKLPKIDDLIIHDEGNYYIGIFVRSQARDKALQAINFLAE